mmetsp:Transcript_8643/g.23430  ORF Transcript_8643/g.23430 Transcript_8643/m.23430 type:complete len:303 (-) Transcript_8643:706-1614(-)
MLCVQLNEALHNQFWHGPFLQTALHVVSHRLDTVLVQGFKGCRQRRPEAFCAHALEHRCNLWITGLLISPSTSNTSCPAANIASTATGAAFNSLAVAASCLARTAAWPVPVTTRLLAPCTPRGSRRPCTLWSTPVCWVVEQLVGARVRGLSMTGPSLLVGCRILHPQVRRYCFLCPIGKAVCNWLPHTEPSQILHSKRLVLPRLGELCRLQVSSLRVLHLVKTEAGARIAERGGVQGRARRHAVRWGVHALEVRRGRWLQVVLLVCLGAAVRRAVNPLEDHVLLHRLLRSRAWRVNPLRASL